LKNTWRALSLRGSGSNINRLILSRILFGFGLLDFLIMKKMIRKIFRFDLIVEVLMNEKD